MTPAELDVHLDSILRASGSKLAYYTMPRTRDGMRAALKAAIESAKGHDEPPTPQWRQIADCPRDGTQFLTRDVHGNYEVLNQPPARCLGVWRHIAGDWLGNSVRHRNPIEWTPIPTEGPA